MTTFSECTAVVNGTAAGVAYAVTRAWLPVA
jgi:hypothetical protein